MPPRSLHSELKHTRCSPSIGSREQWTALGWVTLCKLPCPVCESCFVWGLASLEGPIFIQQLGGWAKKALLPHDGRILTVIPALELSKVSIGSYLAFIVAVSHFNFFLCMIILPSFPCRYCSWEYPISCGSFPVKSYLRQSTVRQALLAAFERLGLVREAKKQRSGYRIGC